MGFVRQDDFQAARNGSSNNTVSVLLNTTAPGATTPSFGPAANVPVGSFPTGAAAADVNGDGRPDLLVANGVDNTASVLLNRLEGATLPPTQTATPTTTPPRTATPTPAQLSRTEATEHVRQVLGRTGQAGVPAASQVGDTASVQGAVSGTGRVTASMTWTLTAQVPGGVAPGTVAHAVLSTHVDLEAFPCTPVLAGVPTVGCTGTTVGNALQNSRVVVVFARGVTAIGTVTGPGTPPAPPTGVGTTAPATGAGAAAVLPLLPPLPPVPPPLPLLPPPAPPFLLPPAVAPPGLAATYPEVPVIPEAETLALLAVGVAGLGALAGWRRQRP